MGGFSCFIFFAFFVENGSLMAALDAGCARFLWPQGHMYALATGRAALKMFSPHLFFFPSHLSS